MTNGIAEIAGLLSCPEDGTSLRFASNALHCPSCARHFPVHSDNLAEILPLRPRAFPASANPTYYRDYVRAFDQVYRNDPTTLAWGAEEAVSESWARKRRRQVAAVERLITEENRSEENRNTNSILCDVAAGAGYYSFAYAPLFRLVIHCDLSVENLSYAWRRARSLGIRNIVFLRTDYFALPFHRALDCVICLDTLIRGASHDSALLASIARSLKTGGSAVVDFHNWWHNPLRRIGILPDNFAGNTSYSRRGLCRLLTTARVRQFEIEPFIQEVNPDRPASRLLMRLLPPTRFMVRLPGNFLRQTATLVNTTVAARERPV
jgi:SAM-dependent methyltransferase